MRHHTPLKLYSLVSFVLIWLLVSSQAESTTWPVLVPQTKTNSLLQFTAADHVLAFDTGEMVMAADDHLIQVKFVDGQSVTPKKSGTEITYHDLWPGVTLMYKSQQQANTSNTSDLAKSSYLVAPFAKIEPIRLRYNVPIQLDSEGNLLVNVTGGQIRESAPIAWQEINGQRRAVKVIFRLLNENEVGFMIERGSKYDPTISLLIDPNITWHTFFGSAKNDRANAIITDSEGRLFIVGTSEETWGEPLNAHAGGSDAFVAKFSRGGKLLWNTFIGGSGNDEGSAIATDPDGRIYVGGNSDASWGQPVSGFNGQRDIFISQLNLAGLYKGHTFIGSKGDDTVNGMTIDENRMLYLVGTSDTAWGEKPINNHAGENDAFVVKINSNGVIKWLTFLGSKGVDSGEGIVINKEQQIYLVGTSSEGWGVPLNKHTPEGDKKGSNRDAFVAKLNADGKLNWHTFLGTATGSDSAEAITLDTDGQIYIDGYSWDSWGKPIQPFAGKGYFDAFVAKLTPDGDLKWHTFLGSASQEANADAAYAIMVDGFGRLYVAGDSRQTWGKPLDPYIGERDGFVGQLDRTNGNLVWHTFLGGSDYDYSTGLATDSNNKVYVIGYSQASWGLEPVTPYTGAADAFLAELPPCLPKCAVANGEPAAKEQGQPTETLPAEPTKSVEPLPTETAQPTKPIEPTKPAEPTKSAEPPPTETAQPTKPIEPVEPTKPVEGQPPTVGAKPTPGTDESKTVPIISNVSPSLNLAALPKIALDKGAAMRVALSDLNYDDVELTSPSSLVEYNFKIPEGWKIKQNSFLRLSSSYVYNQLNEDKKNPLKEFGNIIVSLDGQTQLVSPIQESTFSDSRFKIPLSADLLNDPERDIHTLTIALDTTPNCNLPHTARLTVHAAATLLSLDYSEDVLAVDLARYPYPFDERIFTSTQILFVLPAIPTQAELSSAVAIAARLSSLNAHDPTIGKIKISSLTDLQLLTDLSKGKIPQSHLVLIGTPARNQMIAQLNQWGTLPTPLREHRLSLSSQGPSSVKAGDNVTYHLSVVNTMPQPINSLLLVDTLPPTSQMISCNPLCTAAANGQEVTWFIQSLAAGERREYALQIRLAETLTGTLTIENSIMLLNESSEPLNVNRLASTVSLTASAETAPPASSSSMAGQNFFAQKGWTASESDGIIQELTSPWDARHAILVITGMSDEAIAKAGYAMGLRGHIPGMIGATALINQIQQLTMETTENKPHTVEATLTELGYPDQVLQGLASAFNYNFEIPTGWRLAEGDYFDLRFNHSQLINFENSSLRVLFNDKPLAEMVLDKSTAMTGSLKVNLPASRGIPGKTHKITIQTNLEGVDKCAPPKKSWLALSGQSVLHLSYLPDGLDSPGFEAFPRFFNQPGMSQVMFVLPERPSPDEWQQALQIATLIGQASNSNFVPKLLLGNAWQKEALTNTHLIAIGRPSRNSLLQQEQVNKYLPQPFIPSSDLLEQRLNNVVMRLLPGNSLGILEVATSPWNNRASLLAVTGTTDEGVVWAGRTLTTQASKLAIGDLAFINDRNVNTIDTRQLTQKGVALAVTKLITGMAETDQGESPEGNGTLGATASIEPERPTWLIPLVGVMAVLVVATLALAYWQAIRREREM